MSGALVAVLACVFLVLGPPRMLDRMLDRMPQVEAAPCNSCDARHQNLTRLRAVSKAKN